MSKMKLFDEDSEEEVQLKTENEYAKKYDAWREKEELHKLEQKYGSKALDPNASSSDSEDESDEPPEVSEEMETQFLKTLAMLKTKDPRIYDPNYTFFECNQNKEQENKTKSKTLSFADSDEDDTDEGEEIFKIEKAASEVTNTDNKQVTLGDNNKSEKDKIKDYLKGKVEHIDDEVEKDLAPLKALWSDPKLNDGEAFLRDYILNKRYLEEGDAGEAESKIRDDEDLEADEQRVEEQGKFERAYNFRFEEPDEEYLKRYPRTMNYIRPKDDRRARKRAEIRSRKEEEKKKKMEEIARLKALKLKEIQEKIAKIKEVTGNEDLAFKEEDLDGDFDPEEHDKRMRAIFNEEYYGDADDEKPVFPDLDEELEIENWENYEEEREEIDDQEYNEDGPHCEDDNFNMDADYDPKKARENLLEEMKRNMGKKRRNRKKKSKLAKLLETEKPKFVPTAAEKTYEEFMEEYYKMDCEDVIGGDLPTRFKYRQVVPNDYGLSIEEILLADDKELTQWVPLKKIVKYRPEHIEKGEVKTFAQKAADARLKRKMLPSLFKDLPEEPEVVVPVEEVKKKKKKKKKSKEKYTEANGNETITTEENITNIDETIQNGDVTTEVESKNKKRKNVEQNEINKLVDRESNELNNEVRSKKKKKKCGDFIVEKVTNNERQENNIHFINKESKIEKEKPIQDQNIKREHKDLKRKLESSNEIQILHKKKKNKNIHRNEDKSSKNKKFNKKDKFKHKQNKDTSTNDPLGKLSDERLKAYGLNPKKYRSFLKYKKF